MKLSLYLQKPDRSLNPGEVGRDDVCELGKWIRNEGPKLAAIPEFVRLRSEHAHFHRAAAAIIRKVNLGSDVTEEIALGGASEFAKASSAVVSSLMAMRTKPPC